MSQDLIMLLRASGAEVEPNLLLLNEDFRAGKSCVDEDEEAVPTGEEDDGGGLSAEIDDTK
jgi:hypothetical protein